MASVPPLTRAEIAFGFVEPLLTLLGAASLVVRPGNYVADSMYPVKLPKKAAADEVDGFEIEALNRSRALALVARYSGFLMAPFSAMLYLVWAHPTLRTNLAPAKLFEIRKLSFVPIILSEVAIIGQTIQVGLARYREVAAAIAEEEPATPVEPPSKAAPKKVPSSRFRWNEGAIATHVGFMSALIALRVAYIRGWFKAWLHPPGSTSDGPPEADSSLRLRVLQWNILADGLAQHGSFAFFEPPGTSERAESDRSGARNASDDTDEWNPLRKYPAKLLEWPHRGPLVVYGLLTDPPADFLALMEVNQFPYMQDALSPHGYEGVFRPKPHAAAGDFGFAPDGVALFWNARRWEAEATGSRNFDGGNANQLLLHGIFREKGGSARVLVAGTHFKAKTGAANDATRLRHARETLAILSELSAQHPGMPVVLAGDLNTAPDSEAVRTLGEVFDPVAPFAEDSNGYWTTWKSRTKDGGGYEHVKRTIDYILLSSSDRLAGRSDPGTGTWTVVDRWIPLDEQAIGERGLPCDWYPSDHIGCCADLTFGRQP
ncbi:Endonuclease/exonuclease/phosphatase [Hyaloraphidium curvatum]|nr:Endonuclease/exonuclease/phosphatase [Hyaloraphidium curvatum]